jgi:NADPH:quinone reductase-like Zn-dependent oxidoreductase
MYHTVYINYESVPFTDPIFSGQICSKLFVDKYIVHCLMMPTQRVFRLQNPGSVDNLKMLEESIPSPDKSEILVKIRGISLNYRDIAIITGSYPAPVKANVIPCSDVAGEVINVGSSVEGIKPGDRVIATFDVSNLYGTPLDHLHAHGGSIDGFLREFVTLPSSAVVKMPSNTKLSFTEMASLVCTGATAWNALFGNIPVKPGETVLFQGKQLWSITGHH